MNIRVEQTSTLRVFMISYRCKKVVKVALFSGPRCLSLLRYFEHAKVVFRWKMLVTLTLFSKLLRLLKGVNFN